MIDTSPFDGLLLGPLPCPFCGNTAHVKNFSVLHETPAFVAFCETKDCVGRNSNKAFQTEERAITAWNTRAPDLLAEIKRQAEVIQELTLLLKEPVLENLDD